MSRSELGLPNIMYSVFISIILIVTIFMLERVLTVEKFILFFGAHHNCGEKVLLQCAVF